MSDADDGYYKNVIKDLMNYPIISNSNPVSIFDSF